MSGCRYADPGRLCFIESGVRDPLTEAGKNRSDRIDDNDLKQSCCITSHVKRWGLAFPQSATAKGVAGATVVVN